MHDRVPCRRVGIQARRPGTPDDQPPDGTLAGSSTSLNCAREPVVEVHGRAREGLIRKGDDPHARHARSLEAVTDLVEEAHVGRDETDLHRSGTWKGVVHAGDESTRSNAATMTGSNWVPARPRM